MTRQIRWGHTDGGSVCENDVWSVSAEHKGVDNGNEGNNGPRPPTKYQLKLGRKREREREESIVLIVRPGKEDSRGKGRGESVEEETEERRNTWLYALTTRGAVEANSLLLPTTTVFRNGSRLGGFLSSSRLVSSNAKRDSGQVAELLLEDET